MPAHLHLLPEPQKTEWHKGTCSLRSVFHVQSTFDDHSDLDNLRACFARYGWTWEEVADSETPDLVLHHDPALFFPDEARQDALDEGYLLEIIPSCITISARSVKGARHGLATLRQLTHNKGGIPCGRIVDWPDLPMRAFHMTLGDGHMPRVDSFPPLVQYLADCKINTFLLEYDNRFPFQTHPALRQSEGIIPEDKLREIHRTAEACGVEIIPLLDSLGHAHPYPSCPEYQHLAEVPGNPWELCPSNPDTLRFIQEVWEDVLAFHPRCRFAHISGDEVFRLGRHCPACEAYAERGELPELYAAYYRALAEWLLARGIRPMMWADMALTHPRILDLLPREVIFVDWNYSGSKELHVPSLRIWGEGFVTRESWETLPANRREMLAPYLFRNGCNDFYAYPYLAYLREKGFDVLGASSAGGNGNPLAVADFTPKFHNPRVFSQAAAEAGALGMVNTFWSAAAPAFSALHGMAAGATFAWNAEEMAEEDFLARVEKMLFGTSDNRLSRLAQRFDYWQNRTPGYEVTAPEDAERILPVAETLRNHSSDCTALQQSYIDWLCANAAMADLLLRFQQLCDRIDRLALGTGDDIALSLENVVNTTLRDCVPPGSGSFEGMGTGEHRIYGIPFQLTQAHTDRETGAVALRGKRFPERPDRIEIPLSGVFSRLFFWHSAYGAPKEACVGAYTFCYQDGTEESFPLVAGDSIGDWSGSSQPLTRGSRAWAGRKLGDTGKAIESNLAWWTNPFPEKPLTSLIFSTTESPGYPILFALTGRRGLPAQDSKDAEETRLREIASALTHVETEFEKLRQRFARLYSRDIVPPDQDRGIARLLLNRVPKLMPIYRKRIADSSSNE